MAEKRGRHASGGSSSSSGAPKTDPSRHVEPALDLQYEADETLFENAIRALEPISLFSADGIYISTRDYRQVELMLPRNLTLTAEGDSFLWLGDIVVASVDSDAPGQLILYMPHSGGKGDISFATRSHGIGYVTVHDAAIVSFAYQCILRVLIGVQELHTSRYAVGDAGEWSIKQSAFRNVDELPTFYASDANFREASTRLYYYAVAESPPTLWPTESHHDFVTDVIPLSGGGYACTVLQRHQSGRVSLVRVTSDVTRNNKNLRIHHCLATNLAPYVPQVVGPVICQLGRVDSRVLGALRANERCANKPWLLPAADHINVSTSVMEYAEEGDLHSYIVHGHPIDWAICFRLLCFLYSAQALLGFEHGDLKESNVVLTRYAGGGGDLIPQVVDYDFSNFYPLKELDPNRSFGSAWVAPPEFFDGDEEARVILGAADLWSLGCIMLSWRCGKTSLFSLHKKWVDPTYEERHDKYEAHNAIQQRILADCGLPNYYDAAEHKSVVLKAADKETGSYQRLVRRSFRSLTEEEHSFFPHVFAIDAAERIHHGRLFELFDHPVWSRHMSPAQKQAILQDAVYRHFPQHQQQGLPSTLQQSAQQLCRIIESGYVAQGDLLCTLCGEATATMLNADVGKVQCTKC